MLNFSYYAVVKRLSENFIDNIYHKPGFLRIEPVIKQGDGRPNFVTLIDSKLFLIWEIVPKAKTAQLNEESVAVALSKMKSKLGEQLFHKKFDLNNSLLSRINDIGKPRWYFPPSDEFNEWNPSQITGKIIKKKKEKIAGRNCNCTVVTINNISTTYWVDIDTNLILKWERNQLDSGPHSLRIGKETLDFLLQKQTDSLFFIPSGFTAIIPQVIESEVPTPIGVKRILIPIPTEQELRKGNNVRVNR